MFLLWRLPAGNTIRAIPKLLCCEISRTFLFEDGLRVRIESEASAVSVWYKLSFFDCFAIRRLCSVQCAIYVGSFNKFEQSFTWSKLHRWSESDQLRYQWRIVDVPKLTYNFCVGKLEWERCQGNKPLCTGEDSSTSSKNQWRLPPIRRL
jgi:hypothetical protein